MISKESGSSRISRADIGCSQRARSVLLLGVMMGAVCHRKYGRSETAQLSTCGQRLSCSEQQLYDGPILRAGVFCSVRRGRGGWWSPALYKILFVQRFFFRCFAPCADMPSAQPSGNQLSDTRLPAIVEEVE